MAIGNKFSRASAEKAPGAITFGEPETKKMPVDREVPVDREKQAVETESRPTPVDTESTKTESKPEEAVQKQESKPAEEQEAKPAEPKTETESKPSEEPKSDGEDKSAEEPKQEDTEAESDTKTEAETRESIDPHARAKAPGIRKTFNVERRLYDKLVEYQFDNRIRWESKVVNMALEEFFRNHQTDSEKSED